jgi:hypothetical protein
MGIHGDFVSAAEAKLGGAAGPFGAEVRCLPIPVQHVSSRLVETLGLDESPFPAVVTCVAVSMLSWGTPSFPVEST